MEDRTPNTEENKKHHFLYHIFRMDKEEHPMPQNQFESMVQVLKKYLQKEKE